MNTALPALPDVAGEQLVAFVLVLSRVAGLFVFAPVFSSRMIPGRVRLLVGGAFALALTPLATAGQTIPNGATEIALLLIKETMVGLAFALVTGVVAAAITGAGSLLDTLTGFSLGALIDPITNVQATVFGQLYSIVAVMIFLLTGGDRLMVFGLAKSYELLPLGSLPSTGRLAALATDSLTQVTLTTVEIAAPVAIALVLTDVALGVVSRAAPQLNVFFVGLPAKILVAFSVAGAGFAFLVPHLEDQLASSVVRAVQGLGGS
jgi:flagellar biosynthetic protein FliR